ncbi:hypothetical protein [Fortiea contorta]|uniref:hypothetical protein n=1 Tax=Fortiea contorta TaxID=1892405 RepID=UPI000368B6D4|nr:hypothetical protein [Fortiea contorta]
MNESFKELQNISKSIDEILRVDEISQEIKESASKLNKTVEPCVKEIQQSASRLNNLVQGCFNDLSQAEDIWHSKQRIDQIATSEIWEEVGDLSGRVLRLRRLGNEYKSETVKQVKKSWYKRMARLENSSFYSNTNKPKTSLNIFEKDDLIKNLQSEVNFQLAGLKQKLSPNKAETGFMRGKYVTING